MIKYGLSMTVDFLTLKKKYGPLSIVKILDNNK